MTPQELADRLEITDVIYRYASAIDQKDLAALRDVFAPDAEIDYRVPGGTALRLDDAIEWLGKTLPIFFVTQHHLSNPLIELDGDQARSTTYLQAAHVQRTVEGDRHYVLQLGIYRDRHVRTPRGWRIRSRRLDHVHTEGRFLGPPRIELFPEAPEPGAL